MPGGGAKAIYHKVNSVYTQEYFMNIFCMHAKLEEWVMIDH